MLVISYYPVLLAQHVCYTSWTAFHRCETNVCEFVHACHCSAHAFHGWEDAPWFCGCVALLWEYVQMVFDMLLVVGCMFLVHFRTLGITSYML